MTIATYRGNRYNTEVPKEDHRAWLEMVQSQVGGSLIYRGHTYKPHHEVEKKN